MLLSYTEKKYNVHFCVSIHKNAKYYIAYTKAISIQSPPTILLSTQSVVTNQYC